MAERCAAAATFCMACAYLSARTSDTYAALVYAPHMQLRSETKQLTGKTNTIYQFNLIGLLLITFCLFVWTQREREQGPPNAIA